MLSPEPCRTRRHRLLERLRTVVESPLVLADPLHLRYLAGFSVDPFSLGGDFGGLLVLRADGHTTLIHDDRLPASANECHVDERIVVPWYDGQSSGRGPRRLVLLEALQALKTPVRIHDSLGDPLAATVIGALADLRRSKDADELAQLRRCMRAAEAGFGWARAHIEAGMTELDVYNGVAAACNRVAGGAMIVYGDFAVSPGPERRGGPPTGRLLSDGDLFILDFSVVIGGYRGDFTNTLAVGRSPSSEQQRIFDACLTAMAAGEAKLRAGTPCQSVYDAVREAFGPLAEHFPHHAGHGLGLSHPEAPYFVRESEGELVDGDVVTLEPGLYVVGVGGVRIEHNYLVTADGYERLSHHYIGPA